LVKPKIYIKKLNIVFSNRSFCSPMMLKRKALSVFNLAGKKPAMLARNEYHTNYHLHFLSPKIIFLESQCKSR